MYDLFNISNIPTFMALDKSYGVGITVEFLIVIFVDASRFCPSDKNIALISFVTTVTLLLIVRLAVAILCC